MTHRTRKPLIALLVAAGSVFALPAMAQSTASQDPATAAQPQAAPAAQTWASVDTDGNGTINKSEAQVNAGLSQVFDQADTNKDGELSADEYKAFVQSQQGAAGAAQGN